MNLLKTKIKEILKQENIFSDSQINKLSAKIILGFLNGRVYYNDEIHILTVIVNNVSKFLLAKEINRLILVSVKIAKVKDEIYHR